MKKVMIIGFVFLVGCSSAQFKENSSIIELPKMTKEQIYQKAMQWITYKFVSGRAVMDYKDPSLGRIIAKGILVIPQAMSQGVQLHMIATVDCINGKSKITVVPTSCESVALNGNRFPCDGFTATQGALKEANEKSGQFIEDYKIYMISGQAPAWDGK